MEVPLSTMRWGIWMNININNIATQTTDPLGRTETKTFDGNFRPTEITNSANQTLQMTWSADGVNLLSKTDPAGNKTDYTYMRNLLPALAQEGYIVHHAQGMQAKKIKFPVWQRLTALRLHRSVGKVSLCVKN